MAQPFLINELSITPTTLHASLKAACKKWNAENEQKATVHEFLVNILTYWKIRTFEQYKASELAEELAEVYRDGTPGYAQGTEENLLSLIFAEGVVFDYVEEGKSLPDLLADHPWIVWES